MITKVISILIAVISIDATANPTSDTEPQPAATYESSLVLGRARYQSGRYEDSLVHYKKALERSPRSEDAQLGAMLCHVALKRWWQARYYGENLLEQNAENLLAGRYMALVDYMLEHYTEAEKRYRFVLIHQPDDVLMKLGLGLSLVMQERFEEGHSYCREAELDMPGDERITDCLSIVPEEWTVRPQLFGVAGFYTDAWDKKEFIGGMAIIDFTAPNGAGLQLDFSYSWNYLQYLVADYQQYAPGGALFYVGESGKLWMHYSALIPTNEYQEEGHVLSLHSNRDLSEKFSMGGFFGAGFYDGFQTLQIDPELEYRPLKWLSVKLIPMLQLRTGDIAREESARSKRIRGSLELSFEFNVPYASLSLGGFYGNRWFTIENKGLWVWNSDEDIVAGLRFDARLLPEKAVSPTLGFRLDYADHQFGLPHEFFIIGFTAGLTVVF